MKLVRLFIVCALFAGASFTASAQNSTNNTKSQDNIAKENMKEGDEYKVSFYDTKQKVAELELRMDKIKKNLQANRDNTKYDHLGMSDILFKLQKVYAQIPENLKNTPTGTKESK